MKIKTSLLLIATATSLAAMPAQADRGGGHGHYWGPFGFLLGTAILYSAIQPRTIYTTPQVIYAPPVYAPVPVQPYYVEQTYISPPVTALPLPPPTMGQYQPQEIAGGQWWYFCRKPAGYYPFIRECPSGWEKVSPTPPGTIKP